jgi:alpha-galactosidase
MNRPLTEVYSKGCAENGIWQTEIYHRYVLGLYELQAKLTKEFPHVLLENCASGGGRFDPGMLFYSPQIWCSDNTDAIVRMKIQYGTSLVYPARCVGAHVSTVPNHLTGNITRLRTRGFVAMCGTFGFELDLSTSTPKDLLQFHNQAVLYRSIAPIIRFGDLYRIWDPFKVVYKDIWFICDKFLIFNFIVDESGGLDVCDDRQGFCGCLCLFRK